MLSAVQGPTTAAQDPMHCAWWGLREMGVFSQRALGTKYREGEWMGTLMGPYPGLDNDPLGALASLCPSLGFSFLIYTVRGCHTPVGGWMGPVCASLLPQHLE